MRPIDLSAPLQTASRADVAPAAETPASAPGPVASLEQAVEELVPRRIDVDAYEVIRAGRIVGFIDVVGSVFVVLAGPRYDRATEVGQTLDFDRAVAALR